MSGIQEMNDRIAMRQIKRQNYQQKYFAQVRQLDTISNEVAQLREALTKAETDGKPNLVVMIKNKIAGLISKWNSIRKEVK